MLGNYLVPQAPTKEALKLAEVSAEVEELRRSLQACTGKLLSASCHLPACSSAQTPWKRPHTGISRKYRLRS